MNELNNLLSSYPLSELLILIVGILAAAKTVWTLVEYWLQKIDIHVGRRYEEREKWDTLNHSLQGFDSKLENLDQNVNQKINALTSNFDDHIDNVAVKIEELKQQNEKTHEHQDQMDKSLSLVQERLQENARSSLLDDHHKFCYEFGQIDDLSLQSIERRYLYYKTAGGDTFIDHLMEEIRQLPRVNYYDNNKNKNVAS